MAERKIILEVQNLTKYFDTPRGKLHAVDGVNFTIEEGKTLGIVGESGCGKSTTGRTILKLLEPTAGKIIFNGTDITNYSRSRMRPMRTEMQMIFQDPFSSLDPRQSIMQLISEPIKEHKLLKSRTDIEKRTLELMDIVGLARRFVNTFPHELDGGRRQRIGIARALAVNPKLIVCDEPVSALDVSIQAQILNLLKQLQRDMGLTYIFITHDLSVVKYISDRICVMYLGNMVELSESEELFKHTYHPYTEALLSAIPTTEEDNGGRERILLEGDIPSPVNPPSGCKFHTRCRYCQEKCKNEVPEWRDMGNHHYVACHFPLKQKD